jgi:hypothetical protein
MDNKKIYIISYWFHDYEKLYESYIKTYNIIKSFGEYRHPLEETWLVYTDKKPKEMLDEILKVENMKQQQFFITEINLDNMTGWMDLKCWDWLKEIGKNKALWRR